jgi:hypothetical protein
MNNIKRTKQPFNYAEPVRVYWNFHRKCYSVQQNRLVVGYTDCISLVDVRFHVSEAGRQRVLKERKKNVHAYAIGTIKVPEDVFWDVKIQYNPYKSKNFTLWVNPQVDVLSAKALLLRKGENESPLMLMSR